MSVRFLLFPCTSCVGSLNEFAAGLRFSGASMVIDLVNGVMDSLVMIDR